ncbi:hypothetical protein [Corynebacterium kalidii]|uniref:Acyl-CoA carboxylase subunit epsilon n=1 Tax=Corynebacterium kalidii TaxID=2931982 RepID=A0A9X1WGF2_9CORY|nr:hypothetical protein [Corynebacterium kalidii]MCJ7857988.1 hypothetical protein [Corynebacterium kalidii]
MTAPDAPSPTFTVLKGHPTEVETEAIGRALGVLVAEAARAAESSAGTDPRDIRRAQARGTSRGLWGTPADQFSRPRGVGGDFNPTGFRG